MKWGLDCHALSSFLPVSGAPADPLFRGGWRQRACECPVEALEQHDAMFQKFLVSWKRLPQTINEPPHRGPLRHVVSGLLQIQVVHEAAELGDCRIGDPE